jgi:4-amino-4-deoxy-L-arabinose transferase-like glycosyltransferase
MKYNPAWDGIRMDKRRFTLYAAAIVALALLVREYLVLVAQVRNPYGGDAGEYIAYATNLLHGVFSRSELHPTPDAYRTPGYPVFVMLAMLREGDWYLRLIQWQALLGTATVALVMAIPRSRPVALGAGLLMALWPHEIAATGEVLSEVLLAFVLTLALWTAKEAMERRSWGWAIATGVALGVTYLINPVLTLFPPVAAVVFWRAGMSRQGITLAVVALLAVGGWAIRSERLGLDGSERAYINLVQGSYPLYQAAYVSRHADPEPARIIQSITKEQNIMAADHAAGFAAMRERMAREPGVYARWYVSKPYLLWDWDVRIGQGGPYVHEVYKSPMEIHPLLRATTSVLKAMNPWLFALSLGCALLTFWRRSPLALPALLFLYLTGVHWVLQADPRYATAYRSIEVLLAVSAIGECARRWREVRRVPGDALGDAHLVQPSL